MEDIWLLLYQIGQLALREHRMNARVLRRRAKWLAQQFQHPRQGMAGQRQPGPHSERRRIFEKCWLESTQWAGRHTRAFTKRARLMGGDVWGLTFRIFRASLPLAIRETKW